MNRKAISVIGMVIGALMSVGASTVFRACAAKDDGTWMHCHTAQIWVSVLGVVIAAAFLLGAFVNVKAVQVLASVIAAAAGIIAILTPGVIVSMCMMTDMRCYTMLQPYARVTGALSLVLALITLIAAVRDKA